ncbi:sugar phosphate isomerase/epimerase [Membranicola marinus]|uniref:Sugar phosphate isomerase/epimerase n=1 Tax=Membranihabitans marinus TaxID=1227546 RepID=A0A953HSS2_9BACT|nr:sugar phosphate isomerase/epimerase [Membranihabitans marinus]MBY5960278.1 sugar phosphate isomerase/epimerase [Membranihabitans marinus]
MKNVFKPFLFGLIFTLSYLPIQAQDFSGAEKMGWKLASQAYTFKEFTLEQTLDKLNDLGIKYVEMYGGQTIGAGIEGKTDFRMSAEKRQQLKNLLLSKGITPVAFGVTKGHNEADWNQLFTFAKELGIGVITSEPDYGDLDLVESLCKKYDIKVAIHNHPIPSKYWHPKIVMNLLEGRSELIGVCADIGHWVRSGLDPIESLQTVEGRLLSFHFKDMNKFGERSAHDVPWGLGVSNISGVMHEMKRQGFDGHLSIEYEHNWMNSVPEIREAIAYFARVSDYLANAK